MYEIRYVRGDGWWVRIDGHECHVLDAPSAIRTHFEFLMTVPMLGEPLEWIDVGALIASARQRAAGPN